MKGLIVLCLVMALAGPAFAGSWVDNSPHNPNNSVYNPQNSPHNPNNSPYNPNNSRFNPGADNGIYDNDGNRMGYSTPKAGGGHNYFDDDGNRIGYDND